MKPMGVRFYVQGKTYGGIRRRTYLAGIALLLLADYLISHWAASRQSKWVAILWPIINVPAVLALTALRLENLGREWRQLYRALPAVLFVNASSLYFFWKGYVAPLHIGWRINIGEGTGALLAFWFECLAFPEGYADDEVLDVPAKVAITLVIIAMLIPFVWLAVMLAMTI